MLNSPISIVEMAQCHIDDVVIIDVQSNSNPWSGSMYMSDILSPTHINLVAITELNNSKNLKEVVGYTVGQKVSDEFHIYALAVKQEYRRSGIANQLIKEALAIAYESKIKSVTLEVRTSNSPAISLYKKVGFQSEGVRKNYYADNGEDALIMWMHNLESFEKI